MLAGARGDRAFTERRAARLEEALPVPVKITRKRDGLFSNKSHVAAISFATDTSLLILTAENGQLRRLAPR